MGSSIARKHVIYSNDIGKIHNYKWKEFEYLLNSKSKIAIPLFTLSGEALGVICLTPKDTFIYTQYVENTFINIQESLSYIIETLFLKREFKKRKNFLEHLPKIYNYERKAFLQQFIDLLNSTILENTGDFKIFLYNYKTLSFTQAVSNNIKSDISSRVANQITSVFNSASKIKENIPVCMIDYNVKDKTICIYSSIHNLANNTNRRPIGVLYCSQNVNDFEKIKNLSNIFGDNEKEHFKYISFVLSLFDSLYEQLEKAIWVSNLLGHEVIKPLMPFYHLYKGFEFYYTLPDKKLYEARKEDFQNLFDFVFDYIQNHIAIESRLLSNNKKVNVNFYKRIIQRAIHHLKIFAKEEREINIIIETGSQFPDDYLMNEFTMYQAFFNVLMNAIKYSYKKNDQPRKIFPSLSDVVISCNHEFPIYKRGETENRWKISIRNHGIGILPDDREGIFRTFYQGKNTSKHDNTGLGYGLSIAKMAIEDHNGLISLKQDGLKPDEVTEFIIYLPIN